MPQSNQQRESSQANPSAPAIAQPVTSMRTVVVKPSSNELNEVRALWRANSVTLGFFPEGAFVQHAAQGWILAAVEEGCVLGYLAYRIARSRAVIVHLCVADAARGRGVATALFAALRAGAPDIRGVAVTCRDDFEAAAVWPKFGFRTVGERAAREPGRTLRSWWFDIDHADLFSALASTLPTVVLDANVFFDLLEPSTARPEESRALTAPWVRDAYQLGVTPEVYTEIARSADRGRKRRGREFASSFVPVKGEPAQVSVLVAKLGEILGPPTRPQDESDHRQLAHALAAGAALFVTWDEGVLGAADRIAELFDTVIVRPVDLVNRLDIAIRPEHYLPARLEGSNVTASPVTAADERDVVRVLHNAPRRERASGLAAVVRAAISDCRNTDTTVVRDAAGNVAAILVTRESSDQTLRILAARVRRHTLGPTLARHLLWRAVNDAVRRGNLLTWVTDEYLSPEVEEALADVGFVRAGTHWVKLNVYGVLTYAEALSRIDEAGARFELGTALAPIAAALSAGWRAIAARDAAALERALWPLKIRDANLPSFLVPVRPGWAAQLFGGELASGQLFGVDAERVLRLENAYYRAARPAILRAPGRVLWYVSAGEGYSHSMHVAAASALTEVVSDTATSLFRRFRRYGVFSWQDALASAKGSPEGTIMAFTFSHSHILPRPLSLRGLQAIVRGRTGRGVVVQSPSEIGSDLWCDIYAASVGEASQMSRGHHADKLSEDSDDPGYESDLDAPARPPHT